MSMINTQSRSLPKLLHWVLTGFVLITVGFTIVVARLAWFSSAYYNAAQTAAQNQNEQEMMEGYMGAVRNYFPGNPYSETAANNIYQTAMKWIEQNRQAEALTALKDLRAALYGIQSFYQPLANQLPVIEEQIKKLETAKNV